MKRLLDAVIACESKHLCLVDSGDDRFGYGWFGHRSSSVSSETLSIELRKSVLTLNQDMPEIVSLENKFAISSKINDISLNT
jgi:hypothetical protein